MCTQNLTWPTTGPQQSLLALLRQVPVLQEADTGGTLPPRQRTRLVVMRDAACRCIIIIVLGSVALL